MPRQMLRVRGADVRAEDNIGTIVVEGTLTVTGDFDFEVEDLDSYVNVQMMDGTSYLWTYRDPSTGLQVGDLVEVPFGYNNAPRIAKVVSLGKGYDGPMRIKDVSAALARMELAR